MDICFAIFIDIHRFLIYNNVMVDIPIRITQKVLIIEDDQDLAKMYKNHLEGVGCQVLHVDDGRKGFETAKAEKPDVILLGYDQGRLAQDLGAKMASGALPNIPLVRLKAHKPEELHTSIIQQVEML